MKLNKFADIYFCDKMNKNCEICKNRYLMKRRYLLLKNSVLVGQGLKFISVTVALN